MQAGFSATEKGIDRVGILCTGGQKPLLDFLRGPAGRGGGFGAWCKVRDRKSILGFPAPGAEPGRGFQEFHGSASTERSAWG